MTLSNFFYLLFNLIHLIYQANGFSMKIFPIDSPHLQILPQSFSARYRQQLLVNISLSRAYYARKRDRTLTPESIQTTFSPIQLNYLVTQLSFGEMMSPLKPYVVIDTFTDLTWIQCADCDPCFPLKDQFQVETIPSFVRMSKGDTRCVPLTSFNGSCGFEATYQNGHTEGYMGKVPFIFQNSGGVAEYYPNTAFGCGVHNRDINFIPDPDEGNVIAGVMGLAPGPKSFINQLDQTIKNRFSFCIPSIHGNGTIMSFGDDAQISGDDERKVQTLSFKPNARYHVYLAAIIVNGARLHIDPNIFKLDDVNYTTGFFVDPSSPVTVLSQSAYAVLRGVLVDYFKKYGWDPIEKPATFDLCYSNVIQGDQVYPTFALNFIKSPGDLGEIQMVIDWQNLFADIGSEPGFCLQILPSDGPSIFGAYQQANHRFLFDVKTELLSFVPEKC